MILSENQVKKFQQLYKMRFNTEISEDDAIEKGQMLINLIKLIIDPSTSPRDSTMRNNYNEPEPSETYQQVLSK